MVWQILFLLSEYTNDVSADNFILFATAALFSQWDWSSGKAETIDKSKEC